MEMSEMDGIRLANLRKASCVSLGGVSASGDPLASNFRLAAVGRPGEEWPSHDGEPLMFVCQLNLTTAPAVPPLLEGVSLVTFFVGEDPGFWGEQNGDGWCLRAYGSTDGLVPLAAPEGATDTEQGLGCSWEECDDFPCYDDSGLVIPEGADRPEGDLGNVHRTKIGGWPSTIQSEPWWGYREHPAAPQFCLQVDSEDEVGLMWGDAGTIYIARGTAPGHTDEWFLDWQCC